MEPIATWSPTAVAGWLRGLDPAVQQYPFDEWQMTGGDLLCLSSHDLEKLGVTRIGHQELILEAVEKLCVLNYDLKTDSLCTLTEKLKGICQTLQILILSRRKVNTYDGTVVQRPPSDLLTCVIELVSSARSLFSWLNRYLFTRLNDYSACREIISLCGELAEVLQEDCTVSEREDKILTTCRNISGICESILYCSPECLLFQTATLDTVVLSSEVPEDGLGIKIKTTSSNLHFITGTTAESPAEHSAKILPGDEIIQVNEQVVVGWSRMNLVKKLLEKSGEVCLVLKKVTISSPEPQSSPTFSPQQAVRSIPDAAASLSLSSWDDVSPVRALSESSRADTELEGHRQPGKAHTAFPSEFPSPGDHWIPSREDGPVLGQDLWSETGSLGASWDAESEEPESPRSGKEPRTSGLQNRTEQGSGTVEQKKEGTDRQEDLEKARSKARQKGVATRLSRRRVSCRELGQADCDGWLLKKKDHPGFMSQKWKRFWFVLKGHSLYWYNNPNDEKAIGLIKVSSYKLESSREPKKKYEFQLSHQKYKPFVFAAESLSDMSKWVMNLIASIRKHITQAKQLHTGEEDCYSETEAEDPEDETVRQGFEEGQERLLHLSHAVKGTNSESKLSTPYSSPIATRRADDRVAAEQKVPADAEDDDGIEALIKCLKQGGVSLIGTEQLLTREQYRKSFVKRNKNPQINEKVHAVRAMQSTLKAKLSELQVLNQVLDNPDLTSETFKKWKLEHQELYKEIQDLWVQYPGLTQSVEPDSSDEEILGSHPQSP
ncbi:connector enhancer of kinase suppressor of ras 1 [Microcaecilia unicolor]|uniref:Connector enhancer of kinase suppressor of ras 1 n=1 Tax=Microcaecilia unicolor TaxID=1415580 RepID=A0A6P7ZFW8_9AMPH|nr:connector enhancer of kinase suppressor of ras 1 [Microcaecilia unicolor]